MTSEEINAVLNTLCGISVQDQPRGNLKKFATVIEFLEQKRASPAAPKTKEEGTHDQD